MREFYAGRTIVVTGASSGIGADLARLWSSWGARLALVGRPRDKLESLREECLAGGGEALVLEADVADQAVMLAVRDGVLAAFGHVDLVVANAGVGGLNPATSFSLAIHRRVVETNSIGLANTLLPFVPSMVTRRSGHLVCISSLAAFRGLPNAASYSSTKAQQAVFMESLRIDLRPYRIAVSCIHPGFVETPMTNHDEFRMPFMMPVRRSSLLIAKAIQKRKAVYLYPWPMRLLTSVNRRLPCWLYDRLMPRLSGQRQNVRAQIF